MLGLLRASMLVCSPVWSLGRLRSPGLEGDDTQWDEAWSPVSAHKWLLCRRQLPHQAGALVRGQFVAEHDCV